ncbi:MAG: hypothetical protein ACREFN_07720, partial [Acetobacteraceae bacterium]
MEKYPVLRGISGFVRFVGWGALIVSGVLCLVGFINVISGSTYQALLSIIIIGSGLSLGLFSLIVILIGEIFQVFIDIEHNTYETANLIRWLCSQDSINERMDRARGEAIAISEPPPLMDLKPVPEGFQQEHRKLRVNDRVFH